MPRARKTCSDTTCPQLVPAGISKCSEHSQQAEQQRGSSWARGYNTAHIKRFRNGVLLRDPICTCTSTTHTTTHPAGRCVAAATVADHWPLDKRQLAAQGMDQHDPRHGRGLCKACHDAETAQHQPGGWHERHRQ